MAQRTLVILNPASRNGATGRRWAAVEEKLRGALGPIEVERTRGPRDAERLAREGVRSGVERLVVAGGDGTLSEVASGLLATGLGGYAQIGLLPLGTGCDFGRSLALPRNIDDAIEVIAAARPRRVDAGRATFTDARGAERVSYFVNVSSFGISGLVDEIVNRTTKALGGPTSFAIGAVRAIFAYRAAPVEIRVDGSLVHEGPLVLATGANGEYFGGGMHVAPEARLDDGLLDVVVISALTKPRMLAKLPRIYRGTHLADAAVALHRGRLVEARSAGVVPVELDGEPLGRLPARYEVLPGALSVLGAGA